MSRGSADGDPHWLIMRDADIWVHGTGRDADIWAHGTGRDADIWAHGTGRDADIWAHGTGSIWAHGYHHLGTWYRQQQPNLLQILTAGHLSALVA